MKLANTAPKKKNSIELSIIIYSAVPQPDPFHSDAY